MVTLALFSGPLKTSLSDWVAGGLRYRAYPHLMLLPPYIEVRQGWGDSSREDDRAGQPSQQTTSNTATVKEMSHRMHGETRAQPPAFKSVAKYEAWIMTSFRSYFEQFLCFNVKLPVLLCER